MRIPFFLAALGVLGLGFAGELAACSSTANAVGEGGECFQASDCAPGLICLGPPCTNAGHCSAKIACDQLMEDAGSDAAMMMPVEAAPPAEGAPPPTDSGPPPPDTGGPPPDTGTPPDTGSPPDTGGPPPDAPAG